MSLFTGRLSAAVVEPELEPITLAEARRQLNDPPTEDNDLIQECIAAAREMAEHRTHRQLVAATYIYSLDSFPGLDAPIMLPKPPLQSVESITYVDGAGDTQTLAASGYSVDTSGLLGVIVPAYDEIWPSTRAQRGAVSIRFVTGWPVDDSVSPPVATTPSAIKRWMHCYIGAMYEHREAEIIGATTARFKFIDRLLDRWIVPEAP